MDQTSPNSGAEAKTQPPSLFRRKWVPVAVASVVMVALLAGPKLIGIRQLEVRIKTPADYRISDWAEVLQAVNAGEVNYAALRTQPEPLLRFVASMAEYGPKTAPDQFPTKADKLAYYINAYNALVIYAVLATGVKESVHEVRGVFEPVAGFGFFYGLRFKLDGDSVHLYGLENDILRKMDDARIHAAINCASGSCPPLRKEPFEPSRLEQQLEAVTRSWIAHPGHVRVSQSKIELNPIFSWFESDFVEHAKRVGAEPSILGFIEHHLPTEDRASLRKAGSNTPIHFYEYDWSLNAR